MKQYKSKRYVDRKVRWVIVDENGKIVNRNPSKENLRELEEEVYLGNYKGRTGYGYTNEELLDYLRQFYKIYGEIPIAVDFVNNSEYPSFKTYQTHFRSWNDALILAGLGTKRRNEKYTDKELLDYLKELYQERGIVPGAKDFVKDQDYPSNATYINRFGSWSNALKLVGLDVDSMAKKGVLTTNQQKARLAEINVINHFNEHPIDLAGKNQNSSYDGICPNGMKYDVKCSKLIKDTHYTFRTNNKLKDEIEIYYFLAFNKDYSKLEYVWRVPGEIVEKDHFTVGSSYRAEFNIENMEEYDITDKFKYII